LKPVVALKEAVSRIALRDYEVQFAVRDDGEGVPYEDQSRIFDKFVQ
jgi:signal transduction histidine kinase